MITAFAASSQYLTYNASQPRLKGVSGIWVINLDRRPDRLLLFKERSGLQGFANEFVKKVNN